METLNSLSKNFLLDAILSTIIKELLNHREINFNALVDALVSKMNTSFNPQDREVCSILISEIWEFQARISKS